MAHVEVVSGSRLVQPFLVVAALAVALAGCGQVEDRSVSAAAARAPASAAPAPTSKFQGTVTSIDAEGSRFTVSVWMVWAPVMEARPHDRHVLVDGSTRWDPGELRLSDVRLGEEVQVEADPAGDDWRASKVALFDVD